MGNRKWLEPRRTDIDVEVDNKEEVDRRLVEIKDFKNRSKKATSFITETVDDNIVMSLDVHLRNHVHMWAQLFDDYNTITLA